MAPIQLRLCARGKGRPVHVHIGAAVVHGNANLLRRFGKQTSQLRANRFGKGDVRHDALPEKGVSGSQTCPIVKLGRQQNVPRSVFFLQTTHRCHRDDPADVQRPQRVNVCAMIQFVWQNPVTAPMPRQKINLPISDCAPD